VPLTLEQTFADLADSRVCRQSRRQGHNLGVDESLWSGRAVDRPFGIEGCRRPLSLRMLHVVDFTDDGQIARDNVWMGLPAIPAPLSPDVRT
jgi:hypothetical protein